MRLLEAGLDTSEAMKITGHTQIQTFLRYVNLDTERIQSIAERLDRYQAERDAEATRKSQEPTDLVQ